MAGEQHATLPIVSPRGEAGRWVGGGCAPRVRAARTRNTHARSRGCPATAAARAPREVPLAPSLPLACAVRRGHNSSTGANGHSEQLETEQPRDELYFRRSARRCATPMACRLRPSRCGGGARGRRRCCWRPWACRWSCRSATRCRLIRSHSMPPSACVWSRPWWRPSRYHFARGDTRPRGRHWQPIVNSQSHQFQSGAIDPLSVFIRPRSSPALG